MKTPALRRTLRTGLLAAAAILVGGTAIAPAFADGYWRHGDDWRGYHHDWREHAWREHERFEHRYAPSYGYGYGYRYYPAPAYGYYAPAPVYPAPGLSLGFVFR
jgi:hypothetical protein